MHFFRSEVAQYFGYFGLICQTEWNGQGEHDPDMISSLHTSNEQGMHF